MELRTYEAMFMLDPTKAAQEWDNIKKQIVSMIERRGGVLISARKWGERKLSYEIKGHKRAAYLLMYFQMATENVNVLRRDLQLSEIVMRTLILTQAKNAAIKDQQLQDSPAEGDEGWKKEPDEKQGESPDNSSSKDTSKQEEPKSEGK